MSAKVVFTCNMSDHVGLCSYVDQGRPMSAATLGAVRAQGFPLLKILVTLLVYKLSQR